MPVGLTSTTRKLRVAGPATMSSVICTANVQPPIVPEGEHVVDSPAMNVSVPSIAV